MFGVAVELVERHVEAKGGHRGSSERPWNPRRLSLNENAHEVHRSACPFMAKAELGWRRFTVWTLELMLAHNRVEALHGRCMPDHGRGRIRAEALHAWHNQKDVPYQPLLIHDSPFDRWGCRSAGGRDVSGGGDGNRRSINTLYSARRDDDDQSLKRLGYMPRNITWLAGRSWSRELSTWADQFQFKRKEHWRTRSDRPIDILCTASWTACRLGISPKAINAFAENVF